MLFVSLNSHYPLKVKVKTISLEAIDKAIFIIFSDSMNFLVCFFLCSVFMVIRKTSHIICHIIYKDIYKHAHILCVMWCLFEVLGSAMKICSTLVDLYN